MPESSDNLGPPSTPEAPTGLWTETLPKILGAIEKHLGPGDLADLRRLRPEDPGSPAFWRLVATYLEPHLPGNDLARTAQEGLWATVFRTFAELKGLNAPGIPLGRALAEAGFSELRFSRLLRAREGQLDDAVRGASRILASKGQKSRLLDFASLVLLQDGDGAEVARRKLARHYYSASQSVNPS